MSLKGFGARFGTMLAIWTLLAAFLAISVGAESKARIVRLSDVQGAVQMDRTAGVGFDRAYVNLPLIEGSKLKTGKDGQAEVEFEDGSALRLAANTEVHFTHLALGDNGQKLSTVQVVSGTVYANVYPKNAYGKDKAGDQFLVNFVRESVSVSGAAHFRVELDGGSKANVAVFKGKVSATSPSGQFEVAEKHSATIAFADSDAGKDTFVVARNYATEPSDVWDRQHTDYHDRYASINPGGLSSPYAYGMSDLNYYGSFMMVPGYGNVWQPYFAGANWSPFQDGGWAFYPGAGYMWVSGYPWGWMPYNYGNWAFATGFGWVWEPGNWNGFSGMPRVLNAPAGMKLPVAPTTGHQTVLVGRGLTFSPTEGAPNRLTINPNSAGIGVPRGAIDHLDRVAKTMDRTSRPVVVSTVQPEPPAGASAPATGFGTTGTPSTTRMGGAGTTHGAGGRVHP
jgi:FecR protein